MKKLFALMKEPVNGLTHLFGVLVSIIGTVFLITHAQSDLHLIGFSIYGASLIMLYLASSLLHLIPLGEKGTSVLMKLDHMMIFVLIAGTYTPICLISLRGAWGWSLLGIVWVSAAAGVVMKLFWINAPRWFSTLLYVLMGWIVIVAFGPLTKAVPPAAITWLVAGGVIYTAGAVIFGTKRPRFKNPWFGFHELFHLFVLAGSFAHFMMIYLYV